MRFGVLGPLEVLGDEGPIRLGGQKERTLLALLLVDPGKVVSDPGAVTPARTIL